MKKVLFLHIKSEVSKKFIHHFTEKASCSGNEEGDAIFPLKAMIILSGILLEKVYC